MKTTDDNKKILRIREAYGSIRQVQCVGERLYRDVRCEDVILETDFDRTAWEACGPKERVRIELDRPQDCNISYIH